MSFNQALRRARREKDMTQKQLAKLCKTTQANVSSWEVGRTLPSREIHPILIELFGEEIMTDYPHDVPRKRGFEPGRDYIHHQFGKVMFVAHHPEDQDVLIFEMSDNDLDFYYFATKAEMIDGLA